jgi:iron complex transport system substrate-binding protein
MLNPLLLPALLSLSLLAMGQSMPVAAKVCVTDDTGADVCLGLPAKRVAALSPGATELVWAAGAGDQVVAVVSFSDYPEEAKKVVSVGSHTRVDLERLMQLQPDLVIGWVTGNPPEQIEALKDLGLPVFSIEPRSFEDVSHTIERLATLAGTDDVGFAEAERFRAGIAAIERRYRDAEPVSVFYQVWDKPLMTVNDEHLIGKVITLCGGVNVFGELERLVPRISSEAVIGANPEAILAGGMGQENRHWLTRWEAFPSLDATAQNNLYFIPPSLIQRPTPRMLEGSRLFCEKLDDARAKR